MTHVPDAFHICPTIEEAVYENRGGYVHPSRELLQTAVLVDMNIVGMSVPSSVSTFAEYVDLLRGQILKYAHVADVLVLCFDDPATVTEGKRCTQAERDGRHPIAKETSLPAANFDVDTLDALMDCRPLVRQRTHRYRLMDEAMRRFWEGSDAELHGQRSVAIAMCGVDMSGATRPSTKRCPRLVSNKRWLTDILKDGAWSSHGMGEADVRLSAVDRVLRAERGDELRVILWISTDTDQIPISMHDAAFAARLEEQSEQEAACYGDAGSSQDGSEDDHDPTGADADARRLHTLLVMRQARSVDGSPQLLLVNPRMLSSHIARALGGRLDAEGGHLIGLATTLMAIGGCDFVKPVAACNRLFEAAVEASSKARYSLINVRADPVSGLATAIRRILAFAAQTEERGPQSGFASHQSKAAASRRANKLREMSDDVLMRACWTRFYWDVAERSQHVVQSTRLWGFPA